MEDTIALFSALFLIVFWIFYFIFILAFVISAYVGNWFIFKKAGVEPWKSLIPYYNSWVMSEFTMGHGAYMFLPFIPIVGVFLAFYMLYKLCASFNKGIGFYLGLLFLYPVFNLILAFDKSKYIGVTPNFWEN